MPSSKRRRSTSWSPEPTLATALPFQGLKPYQSVNNGTQTFTVTVTGAGTPLVNSSNVINGSANYTYVVFGPLTSVGAIFALDTFNDPGNGFYSVRVMNTAAGIGADRRLSHASGRRSDRRRADRCQRRLRLRRPPSSR